MVGALEQPLMDVETTKISYNKKMFRTNTATLLRRSTVFAQNLSVMALYEYEPIWN